MSGILTAIFHLGMTLSPSLYYWGANLWNERGWKSEEPLVGEKVIILIPGRDGNIGPLIPLLNNINTPYKKRIVEFGSMRNTNLDTDIQNLHKALEPYKDCEIILIGLSKGGLVGLKYITEMKDSRIIKLITIAN